MAATACATRLRWRGAGARGSASPERAPNVESGSRQNEPIQNPVDLTRRVAGTPPGSKVALRVARGGNETTVETKLGQLKDTAPTTSAPER